MMKLLGQGMTECDDMPDCQNIIHIDSFMNQANLQRAKSMGQSTWFLPT